MCMREKMLSGNPCKGQSAEAGHSAALYISFQPCTPKERQSTSTSANHIHARPSKIRLHLRQSPMQTACRSLALVFLINRALSRITLHPDLHSPRQWTKLRSLTQSCSSYRLTLSPSSSLGIEKLSDIHDTGVPAKTYETPQHFSIKCHDLR